MLSLLPAKLVSASDEVALQNAQSFNGIVVAVSKTSPIDSLSQKEVRDIYLGRSVTFPGTDIKAIALDQSSKEIRKQFYVKTIKKSLRKINSYWARYVFSGKGVPPEKVKDDNAMVTQLVSSANFIGYIKARSVSDDLKIIYRIGE